MYTDSDLNNHKLSETQKLSAKHTFNLLLKDISGNVFTTSASLERRKSMNERYLIVSSSLRSKFATDIIFYPLGSVASGTANETSDSDGCFFYRSVGKLGSSLDLQHELHLPWHINVADLDEFTSLNIVSGINNNPPAKPDSYAITGLSSFFYLSLNELANLQEKALADSIRKEILQSIISKYGDKAEEVWEYIRLHLNNHLIQEKRKNYTFDRGVDETRAQTAIRKKISIRFPDQLIKQKRAFEYIQFVRELRSYPSFQEMKLAFDLN